MIETREFDLQWEGRRCQVDQLGAKAARQVAVRLANLIGTAMRGVGEGASAETHMELVGLGAVLEKLSDSDATWLTDTFYRVTRIENEAGTEEYVRPSDIEDLVFGGGAGLERWRRWLVFCVEMSCGDFFVGASEEAGARQKAAAARMNRSQTTSSSRTSSTGSQAPRGTPTA